MIWSAGATIDGAERVVQRVGDLWFIGGAAPVNGAYQAAIWTSADAASWHGPVLLPPVPPAKPSDHPEGETWFADGYSVSGFGEWGGAMIAVGAHHFGCCDGINPMLWRSDDGGQTWSHVVTEGTAFDRGHSPAELTTLPGGELAIFSITKLGSGASMFITPDLETWTEHPISDPAALSPFQGFVSAPDAMLSVGFEIQPYHELEDRHAVPQVRRSVDARTWSATTPPDDEGELSDVAWDAVRKRFVVAGTDRNGSPRVWLGDGLAEWLSSPLAKELGRVYGVAVTDSLLVAVGYVQASLDSKPRWTAWSSRDGVAWSVTELDLPAFALLDVAVSGEMALIAVSTDDPAPSVVVGRVAD